MERRLLSLEADSDEAQAILSALASAPRMRILELLSTQVCNVSEIAQALDMPPSTATLHVTRLEESGLVRTEMQSGVRGLQKLCARAYDLLVFELPRNIPPTEQTIDYSMPIGAYVDFHVMPPCGLASQRQIVGLMDDPVSFYEPERLQAQLLWFRHGYVEYRFPNRLPPSAALDSLTLSMEACSEAPLHHNDWLSDITIWINGAEVATWTSPADFGGERGLLTPQWWEEWNSQYGLLKVWQVNQEGSSVDGIQSSAVTINDLGIADEPFISVRIGVKQNAPHKGGVNIFGRQFGNYPQDLILRLSHH